MKKYCKWVALMMATMLTAGTLAGCGSSESKGNSAVTSSQESTKASEAVSSELSEETSATIGNGETLVIGIQTNSLVTDYVDNYLTKRLEEDLNIKIEIYELPADTSEVQSKMSLLASTPEDLPDVIMTKVLTSEMIYNYGSNGIFIPLNDYINDPELSTNLNALDEKVRSNMVNSVMSPDGNVYCLTSYDPVDMNERPNRLYINTAWLEKLGLEIPTTTEELYEVLKAFVEQDPNGNGKKDEIGAYGWMGTFGENMVDTLMNAFIYCNRKLNKGLSLSEDGETVIAPFATEEWRAGLEYMARLASEGLLDTSMFTIDATQFKAVLNAETSVVGLVGAGSRSNWTDCNNNPNFQELTLIAPLEGPYGTAYTPYTVSSPTPAFFITSACEYPELAYQLGDYFYDQEISTISRYGEPEVDWTDDPDVCANYANVLTYSGQKDSIDLVLNTTTEDGVDVWTTPHSKTWQATTPRYSFLLNTTYDTNDEFDPTTPDNQTRIRFYQYY